jgi:alkylation response protein AidB-like acyl-CoA dehydrogenase
MTTSNDSEARVALDRLAAEVEGFLRTHLPPDWVAAIDADDADRLASARDLLDEAQWWHTLADAGYVTPAWPPEYGGLGVDRTAAACVARTLSRYRVPRFSNPVGINQAGGALLLWGTPAQKDRHLRRIARHEDVWCQLFSEPGAGSDLAGLATRADRDGDVWRVNGQKVWTSLAHRATHGLLLARTDPDLPKHRGITAFLVVMSSPGVTVRPLRHMAGDVEFNEVFLDDVEVPDENRIGDVGMGWKVALSVLSNERRGAAGSQNQLPGTTTGRSVDSLIRHHSPVSDVRLRQRLARAYVEEKVLEWTSRRSAARRSAGLEVGPEASILKLFYSEHVKRLQELACDLEGPGGQAWEEHDRWRRNTAWSLLRIQSKTIAGGTAEIQRNILGERILGLPREPGDDRDIPWSQVRRT